MRAMTAAHQTLPFGTLVEVRNLENGAVARVRINDRGPFKKNRIIDLSHAARPGARHARPGHRAGRAGGGRRRAAWARAPTPSRSEPSRRREPPTELAARLRPDFPAVAVRSDDVWYRVQVGEFTDRERRRGARRAAARARLRRAVVPLAARERRGAI